MNNINFENIYDIAVIGAGPAGLMASISAAKHFEKARKADPARINDLNPPSVCVIERNTIPGKKLLITGNGRCNFSVSLDTCRLVEFFGRNGRFFIDAFESFSVKSLVNFFESRGIKPAYEPSGKNDGIEKIFPENGSSRTVLDCLISEAKKQSVEIITGLRVLKVARLQGQHQLYANHLFFCIEGKPSQSLIQYPVFAKKILISTGGKTYKNTGSTGDGYMLAGMLGHKIIDPRPSLMPVITNDKNICTLSGISLKNIGIKLLTGNRIAARQTGDILFTHKGISGPAIFEIGSIVFNSSLKNNLDELPSIKLDFIPHISSDYLKTSFEEFRGNYPKKKFLSFIKHLCPALPLRLAKYLLDVSKISENLKINNVSGNTINSLIVNLKSLQLKITGFPDPDKAFVTEGGISLKELNPKTMESIVCNGLYFAGEIIEVAGPEGGYNLQKAFSTGWLAGKSACSAYIKESLKP